MMLLLFMCHRQRHFALAATGGRMGGRSFKSSSSSRSSSSSSSRSSSSSSSRRSSGSSWSSSFSPHSSSSYSYSSSPPSSYSSPRPHSFSSSSATKSSSPNHLSSPSSSTKSSSSSESDPSMTGASFDWFLIFLAIFTAAISILAAREAYLEYKEKEGYLTSSVMKLQVALLGTAKSLQNDLNRICETCDTSSEKGLSYILTETSLIAAKSKLLALRVCFCKLQQ